MTFLSVSRWAACCRYIMLVSRYRDMQGLTMIVFDESKRDHHIEAICSRFIMLYSAPLGR